MAGISEDNLKKVAFLRQVIRKYDELIEKYEDASGEIIVGDEPFVVESELDLLDKFCKYFELVEQ